MPDASLTIGEVAAQVGVRTSAMRYYEDAGLVHAAQRVSGRRRYSPEAVELVRLIRFCQAVGFSLAEVRQLLAPTTATEGKHAWRQLVDAKLAQLEALISRAQAVKGVLEASRDCDCVALENCSFLATGPADPPGPHRGLPVPHGPRPWV